MGIGHIMPLWSIRGHIIVIAAIGENIKRLMRTALGWVGIGVLLHIMEWLMVNMCS